MEHDFRAARLAGILDECAIVPIIGAVLDEISIESWWAHYPDYYPKSSVKNAFEFYTKYREDKAMVRAAAFLLKKSYARLDTYGISAKKVRDYVKAHTPDDEFVIWQEAIEVISGKSIYELMELEL